MKDKLWQLAEPISADILGQFPELDPVLLQLLWNRGLKDQAAIDEFLNPDWLADVHDPFLFKDMKRAVERIYEAIGGNQTIGVFGDYDADGVTAAVIITSTLKKLGAKVEVYLPHREREGYGLNEEAIRYLKDRGVSLLITCDCGVANPSQVSLANSLGLTVIVTDHHQAQAELPAAFAILHPGLAGESYPFKFLSGGGVAFKLVQGLLRYEGCHLSQTEREIQEKWLLDLVAISTVADMVKLTGENRTLVKYGLTVLRKTRRLGLKKLIEVAGLNFDDLDTYAIGFQIAPRINAAGRMDHANAAYALLMSENSTEAEELARSINLTNSQRQAITDVMFKEACEQIGKINIKTFFIQAYKPEWSLGLVGLVAGKLVQQYNRPALVMCQVGDKIAGSGRAGVGGFDLANALTACSEYLVSFGGHKEAAGFSLSINQLENFLSKFAKLAKAHLSGQDLTAKLAVDAVFTLDKIDWHIAEQVELLEPFGQGNPGARFASYGVLIANTQPVGSAGQHLRLELSFESSHQRFIWFNSAESSKQFSIGDKVDVVYEVGVNEWNNTRQLELKVVDIKKSDS
ncbi:MAG: Single-stranded-DNA-specific exonuclease RecJ [Parcubacteria group bacterium GW2011_GWD1_42_9]|uniref:Single-stranded-DNA-specific exonuclease RecJ n=3 Tax=Candidatus Vebleniibacteriota TaxID=1817921 RepID=A0A1G2Q7D3_9BACT|nr:MAG: Single-stranded-DNA-specific exonuclease RecJ [Parcubacteria group bacterium GW2011_GWD1_42_9]KKS93581.1 MAG: Single-stranded-DNA-specific exonuclease RecJ [Parcubacteria group bacterium GW2011_GWE2_43_12]KKT14283.1 MAG: Single-stranded-DNA-specific exonuclease RecJ [Parcubacteria group bacterium GW2011_GWA1_43_27]OHA55898.1 MAG: single-stranded-DNA-specific exonuclease RecJ [Candidatus Veblenbacteria bacterium RIFOXYB1_FULL_43_13]OHA56176.1 MAG: single-stranded-DNA-specific exonuclease